MALTLPYVYHVPKPLHTLFIRMIQDWIITASTVRHAWQSIANAGWRRTISFALAATAFFVYQRSSEGTEDASLGQCRHHPGDSIPVEAWVRHLYYDGIGRPDYASYAAGGTVVYELTSQTYVRDETVGQAKPWIWSWRKDADPRQRRQRPQSPQYAIYPETHPGNCWAMRGSRGSLAIMLARPTVVSAFTIDHAPKSMALDPGSAPRVGELWGLIRENTGYFHTTASISKLSVSNSSAMFQKVGLGGQAKRHYGNYDFVKLGTFAYDWDNYIPFQTFHVPAETLAALGDTRFDTVLLAILDNWGSDDFTCLYRVRIHPK